MVMGDDSCLKGRGFESRHRKLHGLTFFTFLLSKLYCLFEKTEINEKRCRVGPTFYTIEASLNVLRSENINSNTV